MELKTLEIVTQDYMPSDGEHYLIIKTGLGGNNEYGIINHKDIGKDGRLKRQLNGLQMMLSKTVAELIERKEQLIKVDKLEQSGIDRTVAVIMVMMGKTQAEAEKVVGVASR